MNNNEFIEAVQKIGISLNEEQIKAFETYYQLLITENEKTNLTRITKKEEVYLKHFYDSLTISTVIDLTKADNLCDVGSGAGFPGIVIKIVFPKLKVTLIEATHKKTEFLNKVITTLNLKDIKVVSDRVEDHKQQYEIVTARAVAKMNILLELCIPIVKEQGYFIAMKAKLENEIIEAELAMKILGCELIETKELFLVKNEITRNLIKIKKNKKTDKKYPRKFNQIIKNPL